MKPPYALIDGYFEQMLSDEQFAELVDWLHASPDHARAFARWAQLRRQITEQMQGEDIATVMLDEAETETGDAALSLHGSSLHGADFADVLARLDVKDDSEVELVDLSAQLQAAARQSREAYRADRREARRQATQYLSGIGRDLATSPWLYGGLAALVALAVTAWALLPAGSPPPATTAERQTDRPAPERPVAVATLTETHDAQWAAFKLSAGDTLYAGQHLALTEGFAEVTTNDGAVAILEAPTTIELINNPNAMRLHTGKLVGVCETDTSKGFVVRTPHMDITDLGTRFGVDASRAEATAVHVFEGEVTAARPGNTNKPLTLNARQAAVAKTGDTTIAKIAMDHTAFARLLPAQPAGTGVGLAVGDPDPNWLVTAIDGKPLDQPVAATVADPAGFQTTKRKGVNFMPNERDRSQWITWTNYREAKRSLAYQTTFEIVGRDPDSLVLELRLIADKHIQSITLNGQRIDVSSLRDVGPAYTEMQTLTIDRGLIAGPNTLAIVTDRQRKTGTSDYWTGLRAELELIGQRQPAWADN